MKSDIAISSRKGAVRVANDTIETFHEVAKSIFLKVC